MPQSFPLDKVPAEVRRHLAAALGSQDVTLIAATEARLPTGELVRVVDAIVPGAPNVVERTTFTDDGEIRGVAEVERLAGHHLFVPDFTLVLTLPTRPKLPVTIDPRTNFWRLSQCERATETITVTIPPTGVAAKADVYLLADTTGSMGGILAAVQAGASSILGHPGLAGFDVAWGVGNYRDFPVGTGINSYAFAHQLSPTTTHASADAAISAWAAGEGGDLPEGQLFALHEIATDAAIGWRPDSKRIVVWFGDAPGHDPICPDLTGLAAAITEASATADLVAAPSPLSPSARSPGRPPGSMTTPTSPRPTTGRAPRPARPDRQPGSPPRPAARTRPASTPTRSRRRWATSSRARWPRPAPCRSCRPATQRSSSSRSPRRAMGRWPATWSTCSPSR